VLLSLSACGGSGGGGGGRDTTDITGMISAPQSADADGDVNQISSAPVSNQTFAAAQSIPNPSTIGGYVNQPFAGPTLGHSSDSGDERDIYRITAAQNQTLRLTITEANNDLDLHLLDGNCSDANGQCQTNCAKNPAGTMVIESSTASGNTTEQITVPATGVYYVEVCAASGASNYLLTIGQSILSAGGFDARADFVPGEVIVRFRDNAIAASGGDHGTMAASVGLQAKAGSAGRAMLMDIGVGASRRQMMQNLGITPDRLTGIARATGVGSSDKRDTLAVVEALRGRADVLSADPNYYRYPLAVPSDNSYPLQWHYPLINLPQAWDIETGQTNPVTVAVIDTGVLLNHPDLQGKLTNNGYDFIRSTAISNDGDGIDTNPDDPGDGSGGMQSSFHGTHVAGTVGARANDADAPSVAGVTWGGMVMPLRALGVGGGTSYDIMQAVAYAAGQPNDAPGAAGQDQGAARADVINLSLGGGGFSASEEAAYLSARNDRNVIIVAAAGNDGTSTISYPAGYNGVVSTSAITLSKTLAPYSQFGATIDIAAPGGDLSQDLNGDGYGDGVASTSGSDSGASISFTYVFQNGTSMASPHVAGVAALMRSVNPALTPTDFDGHLISGALTEDLAGDGPAVRNNSFGYGMIDAAKAVVAAGGVLQPSLAANPGSINFGTATSSTSLNVQLFGGAALVAPVTASTNEGGNWLTLQAPVGGNMSAGVYQVLVNRGGLAEGVYTGQIVVDSDANDVTIPVILQVSDAPVVGNAGHQIVLLWDVSVPTDPLLVDVLDVAANNGQYAFAFSDVAPGEYFILSGSDNDYDGLICDAGESCGAYPDLNSDENIIVGDDDVNGLDFLVSYESIVTNQVFAGRIGRQGFRYSVD
jgi:serine protease